MKKEIENVLNDFNNDEIEVIKKVKDNKDNAILIEPDGLLEIINKEYVTKSGKVLLND